VETVKCISSLHNIILDFEGYCCLHSRGSQHDSLPLLPPRRPGSSGQTSLVAATSQSVRFARSLATRCDARQSHLRICVCIPKLVGDKRACTLVADTQDITLDRAIRPLHKNTKNRNPRNIRSRPTSC
jgi:hypothetical protein